MGDDNGAPPDEAPITLDYVLGLAPATLAVLDASPAGARRLAYATGNVGVVLDTETKAQTLLRGHVRGGEGARSGRRGRRQASRAG